MPELFCDIVPFTFRLKGTVILRIWAQLLFVIAYTAGVVAIHIYVPELKMDFPTTLINVLGVVIGLLLVFRTNTAYDRYWEGRRLWSTMTQNIRCLTRGIWVGVRETGTAEEVVEKRSVLNLLIAFAYATKNYLREEYSYDSDGIRELIKHIPQFCTPSSNQSLESQQLIQEQSTAQSVAPTRKTKSETKVQIKEENKKAGKLPSNNPGISKQLSLRAHDYCAPTNIPIELSYYIASYLNTISVKGRDLTDPTTMLIMNHALNNLVDCLSGFERILRTPIPLAYSVHLHHIIWLYLLALPFQLVKDLEWWTIAAVLLSSFALLGILGIGWEIENPFGYDDNDLPLDDFCKVIHQEIQTFVGHAIPDPKTWLLSPNNHPLSPNCMENAMELGAKPVADLRIQLALDARSRISGKVEGKANKQK